MILRSFALFCNCAVSVPLRVTRPRVGHGPITTLIKARTTMKTQDTEPAPLGASAPFEEWDFVALSPRHARSPESNDRRLAARRKLGALGKALVRAVASPGSGHAGLKLETRTSLHNPHAFNGGRVERLWTYVCRGKKEKSRLRKVLGRDLAKDLDSAYRNAYLCIAIEHRALEVSLRIHPDAWFDGQNLVNRVKAEGPSGLLARLNALEGFRLQLHDWKGEWLCGGLTSDRLDEFLRFYTPGEHGLYVERRWPVADQPGARGAALADDVPATLVAEGARLLELYRYVAWSEESDFLFGR